MTIVSAALRLKAEERELYIMSASANDARLLHDVQDAVEWEQRMGSFLQQPVFVLHAAEHRFEQGQLVANRFKIVREIGEGAMGIVYEAFDRKRNQRIAIKLAKSAFRNRLSPELHGALRVRHTNICLVNEIHTAQTDDVEVDFLTMELLDGVTLSSRVSDAGKLSADESSDIARQLCAGLSEAHRSGIIHRDLKSGNVILTRAADGLLRVVITDFGLAGEAEESVAVCGTPRYIAPELWQGGSASKASDLYALGVILFEMVFGCAPSAYPEGRHTRSLPRPYLRLLEGCLSLEPARRCEAFDKALRPNYWQQLEWSRRNVLAAGAALVSVISASLWFERDEIVNLFHPLPRRRFVALFAAFDGMDARTKPIVSGVIDAIENELTRAEASNRDLLILSSHTQTAVGVTAQIKELCDSLGANLALEASGLLSADRFNLLLKVIDAKTNVILRHAKVLCGAAEIASLTDKAIRAATALLNVRWEIGAESRFRAGTKSLAAFSAFQAAEELRSRPNDDGLDEAIEKYKSALDADPQYALAYAKLALAYSRLYGLRTDSGALDLAQANADKSLRLDGNLAEGHLSLAYVFEKRGNQEKALDEIRSALAMDPANPRTLLWQAQIYARFNRWSDAQQAYLRLRTERPNYWMAYNDLGYVLDRQGKYQEALKAFRAATVAAPASALAYSNLGALLIRLGKFSDAEDQFAKSLKLKPNGLAYSNLSEASRALGNYEEALASSKQAVKLEPTDDRNWLGLADSYESLPGHALEAQEAYQRAATEVERRLQTDPTDGSSWIWLALYLLKSHSERDPLSLIRKAEQFGASDIDSELAKARVFELTGKRKDALSTLAVCFQQGMSVYEVASIRDFTALRRDPAYAHIQKVAVSTNKGRARL